MISGWQPYCGSAPAPSELLGRWNGDPLLIVALLAVAGAYLRYGPREPRRRRCFAAAFALSALLFVSPLCALSSALFASRVVHHVLLAAAVAPLLVAGLPRPARGGSAILGWTLAQAVVFWAWHAPGVYAWALSSDAAYWLMQLSILGTAAGFWDAIRRAEAPVAVVALFATMVQMGVLGALITLASTPLYAPHLLGPQAWGLTPLEDQQVAGLIMWAPAAVAYLAAALLLADRWLRGGRSGPAAA
jgi:putative membrane protein